MSITKARALRRASFLFFGWLIFGLLACSDVPPEREHIKIHGQTMGTQYNITVVAEGIDQAELKAAVDNRLQAINRTMSTYDPESELMRLNGAAVGQPLAVSADLAEVLALSLAVHAQTNGGFDVTVGPLVNRWGFGPVESPGMPTDDEIVALMAQVGSGALVLKQHKDEWQLTRHKPVFIDLSAVAKGWAVDELAALVAAGGYRDFLVEIGGELRVSGTNPRGLPWQIAVERPNLAPGSVQAAIGVTDLAVATSGSYRNYQMYNGKAYSHTIDPATGKPVSHRMVSVTVLADNCALADALATGFTVLGPEASLALAEREGLAVFLLVEEGGQIVEIASSAFKPYLVHE